MEWQNAHAMESTTSRHLGDNVRQLREGRGLTQQHMAKIAGVPRATWSNLESGAANPTLAVLHRLALALQVSLEEIVAEPRASAKLYRRGSLPTRLRGAVQVSSLLPDKVPGMQIERLASGESFQMQEGDVVVFRGDQRHSYVNRGRRPAVGYSVVMLRPID